MHRCPFEGRHLVWNCDCILFIHSGLLKRMVTNFVWSLVLIFLKWVFCVWRAWVQTVGNCWKLGRNCCCFGVSLELLAPKGKLPYSTNFYIYWENSYSCDLHISCPIASVFLDFGYNCYSQFIQISARNKIRNINRIQSQEKSTHSDENYAFVTILIIVF